MWFALLLCLAQDPLAIDEVLAIESLGERRRSPVHTDTLEAQWAEGSWHAPTEGEELASASGDPRTWTRVSAGDDGWLSGPAFRGGWAWATVEVPRTSRGDAAWRLDARGHADVLVDGEPHAGDVYELGLTRVPLALAPGRHELLFRCGRGRLRATLEPAPAPVYLEERDRTLPDVVRGEEERLWAGVIVANAGADTARGFTLRARAGARTTDSPVPPLLPSSMRKCVLALDVPADPESDALEVQLELLDGSGTPVHSAALLLAVRDAHEKHVRTFVSEIDGSVQYYAVSPRPRDAAGVPALVLSLHGASVEASGQAACYAPRADAIVVAPTNRRPFGFDWEDQGRLDALEVLEHATRRHGTDPRRTVLTGHSMGGHGTWQLGAHYPDRFAAIAPSAGWRDFWTYSGASPLGEDDALGGLLDRAANASRTELLLSNYAGLGVYVLHGDADETVPVTEARAMRAALGSFHPDFAYHEQPGAGHWWGNECMDWPPLMDFLLRHRLPEPSAALDVDFTTVDASVSSRFRYLRVVQQTRVLERSHVVGRFDRETRVLTLELENVDRLGVEPAAFAAHLDGGLLRVRIDGSELELAAEGESLLGRGQEGAWQLVTPLVPWDKGAHRAGPFKAAFRHRFLLVYGTRGTPVENAWALAKARYDHEQWRYRGNGAVDVLADVDFRPADHPDRDVILYGNQDTNGAWASLLPEKGLELHRDRLRIGEHAIEGDPGLALLLVHPRPDSATALVGVIGHTGMAGARATTFLPYFVSGVGFSDWTVIGIESLRTGLAGFRGTGFFRADWSSELGAESVWR